MLLYFTILIKFRNFDRRNCVLKMRKRGWEWQKETIIGDEHALYGCEFVSCCLLKLKSWQQSLIKGMRILFSDIVQKSTVPNVSAEATTAAACLFLTEQIPSKSFEKVQSPDGFGPVWPDLAKSYKFLANFCRFISYLIKCWAYFGKFATFWG